MTNFMNAKLIGLTGAIGAGKDTVANILALLRPGQVRLRAFAAPLKQGVQAMFGWTSDQIEDREFKEAVDPNWGFTPRKAMQLLGTEYGRQLLRDDIWVHAAVNYHAQSLKMEKATIMTDVRFENEAKWIRSVPDSLLIHVANPEHDYNAPVKHASEAGVVALEGDIIIFNDKRLGVEFLQERLVSTLVG